MTWKYNYASCHFTYCVTMSFGSKVALAGDCSARKAQTGSEFGWGGTRAK